MAKLTQKEQITNLETQVAEKDDLIKELQAKVDSYTTNWYNLDQMVQLPASLDEIPEKSYFTTKDGIEGVSIKVRFLKSRVSAPSSRVYDITAFNNGFGDLKTELLNRIESGNRNCIIRGRHDQNDWQGKDEMVTFDKWKAISVTDVPEKKQVAVQTELATA
tara:strand:+ start:296 stop:781 length:486 start_codon:yes stop_codon:yes gene_type:complete